MEAGEGVFAVEGLKSEGVYRRETLPLFVYIFGYFCIGIG